MNSCTLPEIKDLLIKRNLNCFPDHLLGNQIVHTDYRAHVQSLRVFVSTKMSGNTEEWGEKCFSVRYRYLLNTKIKMFGDNIITFLYHNRK